MKKMIIAINNQRNWLLVMALALVVAGGVFAQNIGDTLQINGQVWTVLTLSGDTMVLQRGGAAQSPQAISGSLNGDWEATGNLGNNNSGTGPTVITFSGNGAVISGIGGTSSNRARWVTALSNGTIRIGAPCIRNIQSAGTANTWACEILNIASNGTTSWGSTTIVLGADGTLTVNGYSWYKRR